MELERDKRDEFDAETFLNNRIQARKNDILE